MRGSALVVLAAGLLPPQAWSQPWDFSSPVDVTLAPRAGIFHHLDASGRRHVAVSGSAVAVVWEDNSGGKPAVYLSVLGDERSGFSPPVRVSGVGEAYEPGIVAVSGGAFFIAWEEDNGVWVRPFRSGALGTALKLADRATQVSLSAGDGDRILALWAETQGRFRRIRGGVLRDTQRGVVAEHALWIDVAPGEGDQSHPVAAHHRALQAWVTAWEDRRYKNTVLLSSIGDVSTRFSIPMQVNELIPPRSGRYGRGTGVARIALTPYGDGVAAAWADKRNFEFGYDVYTAFARRSGRFGENALVQDAFAEGYEQWHPTVAGDAARLAIAWDDDRDGSSDVWLSWFSNGVWSDDLSVPGASGPLQDSHPSMTLDGDGNLHLVWLVRADPQAPTQVRYLAGRRRVADGR